MLTDLGKVLRIIRINTNDSMKMMADKLDLSISYLSAIENGKRNIPDDFKQKVLSSYNLSEKDKQTLEDAIVATKSNVKVNLTELSSQKKKIIMAVTQSNLDDETIKQLCAIIDKKEQTVWEI